MNFKFLLIIALLCSFRYSSAQTAAVATGIKSYPATYDTYKNTFQPKINDARIIGLGECTHGGSEIFKARTELIKSLVQDSGFKEIIFEFDDPSLRELNNFIHGGTALNIDSLLKQAAKDTPFCCAEIKDLLLWLKDYNQKNSTAPVSINGMDINLDFFYFVDHYIDAQSYKRIRATYAKQKLDVGMQYKILNDWFIQNEAGLEKTFHPDKFEQLKSDLKNFEADVLFEQKGGTRNRYAVRYRDSIMAENVKKIATGKAIVNAHNLHICRSGFNVNLFIAKNLGSFLNDTYHNAYYCVLTDFSANAQVNIQYKDRFNVKTFKPDRHSAACQLSQRFAIHSGLIFNSDLEKADLSYDINAISLEGRLLLLSGTANSFDALLIVPEVHPSQLLL